MVEPVAVGEVEPGVLRLLEVLQPPLSWLGAGQRCPQRLLAVGAFDLCGEAELDRQPGETLELIVRPEGDEVEARDHLRDRLVGDVRERLAADLIEDEVGTVAEVDQLEVVVANAVQSLEQTVIGDQEPVG